MRFDGCYRRPTEVGRIRAIAKGDRSGICTMFIASPKLGLPTKVYLAAIRPETSASTSTSSLALNASSKCCYSTVPQRHSGPAARESSADRPHTRSQHRSPYLVALNRWQPKSPGPDTLYGCSRLRLAAKCQIGQLIPHMLFHSGSGLHDSVCVRKASISNVQN